MGWARGMAGRIVPALIGAITTPFVRGPRLLS